MKSNTRFRFLYAMASVLAICWLVPIYLIGLSALTPREAVSAWPNLPILVGEAYNWQGAYQNTHVASADAMFILLLSIGVTLFYLKALKVNRETLS
ncbi:hypothetical protein [Verminephrobacter aporrectodeae]|uniref:hypothetical protein n=1 Tax=Verminephrobacter aporrectodeae TaxID=1110389 RepID=UPI002237DBE9|nr:hypothetical protein [Verminephrobacter aporrectodeae]